MSTVEHDPKRSAYQRLHAVMGEVDYIQKEKKQGMNYTIVSHDKVTAKVRPIVHKHGLVYHPVSLDYVQDGNRTQVSLVVRFVNVDDRTDFVDVPCLGFGIDSQDKGPGKAVSYAVKYALLKALGLETGDDPDEVADTPAHEPAPVKVDPITPPAAFWSRPEYTFQPAKSAAEYAAKLIGAAQSAPNMDCLNKLEEDQRADIDRLRADSAELHGRVYEQGFNRRKLEFMANGEFEQRKAS